MDKRQMRGQHWLRNMQSRPRRQSAAVLIGIAALLYVLFDQQAVRNDGGQGHWPAIPLLAAPPLRTALDFPIAQRTDIARHLEEKHFITGIELGVQRGAHPVSAICTTCIVLKPLIACMVSEAQLALEGMHNRVTGRKNLLSAAFLLHRTFTFLSSSDHMYQ